MAPLTAFPPSPAGAEYVEKEEFLQIPADRFAQLGPGSSESALRNWVKLSDKHFRHF